VLEEDTLTRFGSWREQLDAVVALRDAWEHHPLVEIGIGPHAAYSLSDECLRAITEVGREAGMLTHIHVDEQAWERAALVDRFGLATAPYLDSIGMLENRLLAAHGVWLDDDDIRLFADHDVAVAHCPCSNTKHASGIAPVGPMIDAGLRVGLGTDGPASHHRLDLFEEMRTAVRLGRLRSGDASSFTTERALWMATAGGADAIDRPDLGRLMSGACADMIGLRTDDPAFHPSGVSDDVHARLVWSGSPSAVTDVWVSGVRVVDGGQPTRVDLTTAIEQVDKCARGLSR
jgi:5-methylthioadenosine/S-adenosylhomocysteine deaminase